MRDPCAASAKRPRLVRAHAPTSRFRCALSVARFRVRQAAGERPIYITPAGDEIRTLTGMVRHQARHFRVSSGQVWRWAEKFSESGYPGLIDRPRRDSGASRSFKGRDAAAGMALVMRYDGHTFAAIYRRLVELWPRLCRGSSRPPSYGTLRNFLRAAMPPAPRAAKRVRAVRP